MEMSSLSQSTKTSTYHIYLKDEVLFKDLNQYEFDLIWGRIYRSYFTEDLTYERINYDDSMTMDASY